MKDILTIVNHNEKFALGNDEIHTVGQLIDGLKLIPRNSKLNGRFSNGHGQYSDVLYLGYDVGQYDKQTETAERAGSNICKGVGTFDYSVINQQLKCILEARQEVERELGFAEGTEDYRKTYNEIINSLTEGIIRDLDVIVGLLEEK